MCTPSRSNNASELQKRTQSRDRSESLPQTLARTRLSEGSIYHNIDPPHLVPTPWESDRRKWHPAIIHRRSIQRKRIPARLFQTMPREIYDCILAHIRILDLKGDRACSSCYLRDMVSLSLVSKAWNRAAIAQLYRSIILPPCDVHDTLSDPRKAGLSRLKMLHRTLREQPTLGQYVLELNLAEIYALYNKAGSGKEDIVNQVASLVMAAPNLERLLGFQIPFTHSFDRLSHALSIRRNLKEQFWLLGKWDVVSSEEEEEAIGPYYHEARDPTERFLLLNSRHDILSTLVLHQEEGQTFPHINFRAIIGALRHLPALRHLALSGLVASSFTNVTLNALPAGLRSLRLENLAGVNDSGLQRFFKSPQASSVARLTLVNLALKSLLTLSDIFSASLSTLSSFTIAQDQAPMFTAHTTVPNFRSPNLRYIHWEFRSEAGPPPTLPTSLSSSTAEQLCFPFKTSEPISCLATSLLATSIQEGGFPALHHIRIPHDPQGLIQNLCKPLFAALTPYEVASLMTTSSRRVGSNGFSIDIQNLPDTQKVERFLVTDYRPSSVRADSGLGSSSMSSAADQCALSPLRSRIAAHCRILAARKEAAMKIQVVDPNGAVCVNDVIGGYVGDVASQISYELEPDRIQTSNTSVCGSSNRSEWLIGVQDLIDDTSRHKQRRGSCGHAIGSIVGRDAVRAENLF